MKSKLLCLLFLVLLHAILVACSQNLSTATTSAPVPTKPVFLTGTSIPATTTQARSITITSTVTSLFPTLTPPLLVTKAPTYSRSKFLELYSTNGNCQLPCWWGVVPGESTVDEAKVQFARYSEFIVFEEERNKIFINYPSPSNSIDYFISSTIGFDETGTVTSISLDPESAMFNGFNPTYLLTNIGKPDQVQMTISQIAMLYDEQSVLAVYDVNLNPDTNQICFQNFNGLELGSSPIDSAFLLANDQIDITDVQSFYDAFKTWKGSESCFSFQ